MRKSASILLGLSTFALLQAFNYRSPAGPPVTPQPRPAATAQQHYMTYCSGCHGEKMEAFADRRWKYGKSRENISDVIRHGRPDDGMPAFAQTFSDKEIRALTDFIITGIGRVDRYQSDETPRSDTFRTEALNVRLEKVLTGLDVPWAIAFLPGGELLVSDRGGTLYRAFPGKAPRRISGTPAVLARGQGGLMDVLPDPAFASNGYIYLSYSKPQLRNGRSWATTAIMRARLRDTMLSEQKDLFIARPYAPTQHHYGSRIVASKDGYLYFSVGERGNERQNPQQTKDNDLGKIHRIKKDGSIPAGNPFPGQSIYSYGHRNPQALAINPWTGELWETEHGPRGGDEINIIRPGRNYGWPVVTYGINYNGKIISPISRKAGIEDPLHYWIPSIGPSGMAFVSGNRYKAWQGNLLSGSLRFKYLNRSVLKNNKVVKEEILFRNIGRVRDVRMAPDGYIYIAVESPGIIYKIVEI